MKRLIVASAVLIGILLAVNFWVLSPKKSGSYEVPVVPTNVPTPILLDAHQIFNLVNDYRIGQGLNPLVWNQSMCDFANTRLQQIHTDFSHDGYTANPHPYGTNANYSTAENLIDGFADSNDIVRHWIDSPEHKVNIMNPIYTQSCVAADSIGAEPYVVQEFASNF